MKKYWLILIVLSAFILTGCGILEGKKLLKNNHVLVDSENTSAKDLLRLKLTKNLYIDIELLGKISDHNDGLVIETDKCFIELTDEYKDVVTLGDNVWITFDCAKVSSFNKDTVTFTYDDILMYKVVSSEELFEMYGGKKCNTYYITYIPKGLCTYYDYGFDSTTGYYVESMDLSYIDDSLFPYDYFKEEYWADIWTSPYEEEDELHNTNRLLEIDQSNIGISKYMERFEDSKINY